MRNTFKVYERLKREQHINTLFLKGKAFSVFPLRVVYIAVARTPGTDSPVKAGFSVPKKKFRSSVDRHRIRRLMVESWRLSKGSFYPYVPDDLQLHVFFIFTNNVMPSYDEVNSALLIGLEKLKTILPSSDSTDNN